MNAESLKLYAITDRTWLQGRSLAQVTEEIIDGGATILQLREKHLPYQEFLAEAKELQALCRQKNLELIINDNVEIAREIGAGVHLGQGDLSLAEARALLGPDAIIGISCQTVAQAIQAAKDGADYLGVGAVFPTATKHDADYVDSRELSAICGAVEIPVVAIGGINMQNIFHLSGSGIAGVSVISALYGANSPRLAAQEMRSAVEKMLEIPVPDIPGAIIDLDGTLIDSLGYWSNLATNYLADKGKTPNPDIQDFIFSKEICGGAKYLKETYGISDDLPVIIDELLRRIYRVYAQDADLLPGVREKLQNLKNQGYRMYVFSATAPECISAALRRHDLSQFFEGFVSTYTTGLEKANPEAYLQVLGRLGTRLERTIVVEDAQYAIDSATKAGFRVIKA